MGRGRVLVVDDEADLRKSVRLTLTKAGYDVIEAEDGEKAIEAVRSGDNPLMLDSIIMDLMMPKVNGVEATSYIRSQFPGVPILVLTGSPNIGSMNELYKKGIVDYLVKPIAPDKLVAAVEKAAKEWQLKSLQG
jgi:two-component system chemotaxis response regulator CheY